MRRDSVVGQAVPGRKLQCGNVRGEKTELTGERVHALPVPAYDQKAYRAGTGVRRYGAGEIGDDESLGTFRDARERKREAGCQQLDGRTGHGQLVHSRP